MVSIAQPRADRPATVTAIASATVRVPRPMGRSVASARATPKHGGMGGRVAEIGHPPPDDEGPQRAGGQRQADGGKPARTRKSSSMVMLMRVVVPVIVIVAMVVMRVAVVVIVVVFVPVKRERALRAKAEQRAATTD